MDKYDRYNNAVASLVRMHIPRRRMLKSGLGVLLGGSALGLLSNCGPEQAPASAPTATTVLAPPEPTATANSSQTIQLTPTSTTSEPTPAASEVPYWQRTSYPYGGPGIADRAIEAAKAETNKSPIGLVYPSGTRPNFDEPFLSEWKSQTGIEVHLIEVPTQEISLKIVQGAVVKEENWDIVGPYITGMGDLEGAGAVVDWTDYAKELGEIETGKPWGYLGDAMSKYTTHYRGKFYGLLADNDTWVMIFRKDLFEDPNEREGFQKKYGYEMKMDTWDQYRDVSEWFTRPEKNMYGASMCRAKNWGFFWWELHYGIQSFPNQLYFDNDMHPLVNSPQGIAATNDYISFKPYMHPDISNWDWTSTYAAFASGSSFTNVNWVTLVKYAEDPSTSQVVGKTGIGVIPGKFVDGKFNRKSLFAGGMTLTGWKYGKASKKAAYAYAQWITSPEISPRSMATMGYRDPARYSDTENPLLLKSYPGDTMKMIELNGEMALPDIFMQGANEYTLALDTNVHSAFTGSMTPEQAMEETANSWEDITDRIGRDSLKEVWAALKEYYPTTIPNPVRERGGRDTEPA